jgi:formate dehydrogenase subunit gamma
MRSTAGSTEPTRARALAVLPERPAEVRRFGRATRLVHRTTGYLMLLCGVTASCLYIAPLAQLVGRRELMVTLHEWSGILLPVPLLLGTLSPEFRADLRRLNRFAAYDREWLRAAVRRLTSPGARPAGKFNAGQKLYAGWIAGAVLVMMTTGLLMWFSRVLPAVSRTSAIFVHDCLAWVLVIVLYAHMRKAAKDPEARRGMRTGFVSRTWARREHSRWLAEEAEEGGASMGRPSNDPSPGA